MKLCLVSIIIFIPLCIGSVWYVFLPYVMVVEVHYCKGSGQQMIRPSLVIVCVGGPSICTIMLNVY